MPAHAQRMSSLLAADKEVAALNMNCMPVTLEVSKLSGWLNADAYWNMPYIPVTMDVSKFSGWLNADAEWNMLDSTVTLDVSKLSGWLNADAYCREPKEAYDAE